MDIKKRFLPAVLIVVVTFGCILLSRFTRIMFFLALAVASAYELQQVLERAEVSVSVKVPVAYITAQAILCGLNVPQAWMTALFLLAAFFVLFRVVVRPSLGARAAIYELFVLVWPYSFYAVIMHAAASDVWLLVLVLSVLGTWACDCMALIGGKYLGVHKMAPVVSPHKTWEGAICGGLAAVVAGMLISWILGWNFWMCVCVSFTASCFGQVGDLAASLFKRMAGVKDYGHLLPEHGGVMDKMDSILFAVPAAYFMLALFVPGIF